MVVATIAYAFLGAEFSHELTPEQGVATLPSFDRSDDDLTLSNHVHLLLPAIPVIVVFMLGVAVACWLRGWSRASAATHLCLPMLSCCMYWLVVELAPVARFIHLPRVMTTPFTLKVLVGSRSFAMAWHLSTKAYFIESSVHLLVATAFLYRLDYRLAGLGIPSVQVEILLAIVAARLYTWVLARAIEGLNVTPPLRSVLAKAPLLLSVLRSQSSAGWWSPLTMKYQGGPRESAVQAHSVLHALSKRSVLPGASSTASECSSDCSSPGEADEPSELTTKRPQQDPFDPLHVYVHEPTC